MHVSLLNPLDIDLVVALLHPTLGKHDTTNMDVENNGKPWKTNGFPRKIIYQCGFPTSMSVYCRVILKQLMDIIPNEEFSLHVFVGLVEGRICKEPTIIALQERWMPCRFSQTHLTKIRSSCRFFSRVDD